MWFHFTSAVGLFWIRPQPGSPGSFWLGLDDDPLCAYHSPELAAQAVARQDTGYPPWDELDAPEMPATLAQWQQGVPE